MFFIQTANETSPEEPLAPIVAALGPAPASTEQVAPTAPMEVTNASQALIDLAVNHATDFAGIHERDANYSLANSIIKGVAHIHYQYWLSGGLILLGVTISVLATIFFNKQLISCWASCARGLAACGTAAEPPAQREMQREGRLVIYQAASQTTPIPTDGACAIDFEAETPKRGSTGAIEQ